MRYAEFPDDNEDFVLPSSGVYSRLLVKSVVIRFPVVSGWM
jgi:hypothetical protein